MLVCLGPGLKVWTPMRGFLIFEFSALSHCGFDFNLTSKLLHVDLRLRPEGFAKWWHQHVLPFLNASVPFRAISLMSTAILLESPHIQSSYSPIRTSFLSSEAYVVGLASLPAHYAASASSPSNTIDIFDKTTLQGVNTLAGHESATTCIKAVDSIAGNNNRSLISSGRDGSIKVWDERTGSHSIKSKL